MIEILITLPTVYVETLLMEASLHPWVIQQRYWQF